MFEFYAKGEHEGKIMNLKCSLESCQKFFHLTCWLRVICTKDFASFIPYLCPPMFRMHFLNSFEIYKMWASGEF